MNTIPNTNFNFPGQTKLYRGKVRDVYTIDEKYLVMIASDRISCFDIVLPKQIPFKGQVLNQLASKFLKATSDIVPNWVMDTPDPNVTLGLNCEPFMVEMVIRAYLTGHAWREYRDGKRTSVERVTQTIPLLRNNIQHVVDTALAGELLGMKLIYLEAGSGAKHPVDIAMISEVKKELTIPLIVGGGIKSKQQLDQAYNAGADLVVIGTAFEEDESFFNKLN